MTYRLVIQFPLATSMPYPDEFESLAALESQFRDFEGNGFKVDGHDMGSGEFNIIILTSNPRAAFKAVEPFLPDDRTWRAGYRSSESDVYEPLAPRGLTKFEVKKDTHG